MSGQRRWAGSQASQARSSATQRVVCAFASHPRGAEAPGPPLIVPVAAISPQLSPTPELHLASSSLRVSSLKRMIGSLLPWEAPGPQCCPRLSPEGCQGSSPTRT